MNETLEDKAYQCLNEFRRVTPCLFMRRFSLSLDGATKLCAKIWLRQHLEARKLAKEVEYNLNI